MRYIKIVFTKGLDEEAYQEVDSRGNVVRFIDLDGDELKVPEVYECAVKDDGKQADQAGASIVKVPYVSKDPVCELCGR